MSLGPEFLSLLDGVKHVLCVGCGGGMDFTLSALLVPFFMNHGITVHWASFSFTEMNTLSDSPIVYHAASDESGPPTRKKVKTKNSSLAGSSLPTPVATQFRDDPHVRLVNANSACDSEYAPEVHFCAALDALLPGADQRHHVFALNARRWAPRQLVRFFQTQFGDVEAVLVFDGGSDSLLRGDEPNLGDPIEDCTCLSAVNQWVGPSVKLLFNAGVGSDRHQGISDFISMRCIADLQAIGASRGMTLLTPQMDGFKIYKQILGLLREKQTFQSVLSRALCAATQGQFAEIACEEGDRFRQGELFVWPLMSMLFSWDLAAVANRSLVCYWISTCKTRDESVMNVTRERRRLNCRSADGLLPGPNSQAEKDF